MSEAYRPRILIVDDEKIAIDNLSHVMKKEGYEVTATQSSVRALTLLEGGGFDVVLTDLKMERVDGMQVLSKCRELHPETEVVLITGYATLESAVAAMKQGAFYYIAKPFRLDEVRKVVKEAAEKVRLKLENKQLREHIERYQGKVRIITQDGNLLKLLEIAAQIAPTDCNVLISGESGTGKELFARYIHYHSNRAESQFLAVNCATFTNELLSSELFGYEKGAFTGAIAQKKGLIEAAAGGTVFLDEITEMSPLMQVKLLRVIQEKELLRVGATHPLKTDVRYIAATNKNPAEAVKNGDMRQDLYFRLNVVSLEVPPLASRKDDIPILCYYFLNKYSLMMKKDIRDILPEVIETLMFYDFPGNVRELENIIERATALATGSAISVAHLTDDLRGLNVRTFRRKEGKLPTLQEQETAYIKWVLKEANGNKTLAAQILGIDRVSLWRKLGKGQAEER
ncbi:sigma-54-dependent transcriptional regulator [Candidatus Magnetobacterium casense]|uniref:Sigma-54-dependent Fis family transcriptional regulator n=1 Tax=Candidatus Magnetobacterium casense TaxID=1455061 RepID=A0ABS6RW89_9BACT|nr:sigma-54 dependent transcriptional regulator [Candidatus Magnetobacterium casensis]MBV6340895.1 sigma-54-dependent Fis family transcriptional regulator [Candidatus Magnetobacterium casensis]